MCKNILKQYIDGDKNKILKLKAQIAIENDNDKFTIINVLSSILPVFSLCLVIIDNISGDKMGYICYAAIALLTVFSLAVVYLCISRKCNARKVWRKYIEAVLPEIEKEMNKE